MPKIPTAGELRDWITIAKASMKPDDGVGFDRTLTKIKNVKAQVIQGTGSYSRDGNSTSGLTPIQYLFVVRIDPQVEVLEGMYIVFENREYLIVSVKQNDRKFQYLTIATIDNGNIKIKNPILTEADRDSLRATQEISADEKRNPFLNND